jgi:hypothetical protein
MKRARTAILTIILFSASVESATSFQGGESRGLISKSTKAIGYQVGGKSTLVDLKGTDLMAYASGKAKVEAKKGITNIEVNVLDLGEPTKFGAELLTYVLWAVSPDGRSANIGELLVSGSG